MAKQQNIVRGEINTVLSKLRLSTKFKRNIVIKEWRTPPLKMHYLWTNIDILYESLLCSFTIYIYFKHCTIGIAFFVVVMHELCSNHWNSSCQLRQNTGHSKHLLSSRKVASCWRSFKCKLKLLSRLQGCFKTKLCILN